MGHLFDDMLDGNKRQTEGLMRIPGFLSGWVVSWRGA